MINNNLDKYFLIFLFIYYSINKYTEEKILVKNRNRGAKYVNGNPATS